VDASGNLYIADTHNHRIRKVTSGGIISTVAGNGTVGFSGDGGLATSAQLGWPEAVTVDAAGNIYFTTHYLDISAPGLPSLPTILSGGGSGHRAHLVSTPGPIQALLLPQRCRHRQA